jgi:hypothetical protein
VDAPAKQPIEDPKETEEQTVHSPQRRRSGRTRAQVTLRPEGQRHEGCPPPRARGHPQLSTLTSGELQLDRYRPLGSLRSLGGSHLSGIPGLQRVCRLEALVEMVGEQLRLHLSFLPRLSDLLGRARAYCGT